MGRSLNWTSKVYSLFQVDVAVAGAARLAAPTGRSGEPSRTPYTSLKGALAASRRRARWEWWDRRLAGPVRLAAKQMMDLGSDATDKAVEERTCGETPVDKRRNVRLYVLSPASSNSTDTVATWRRALRLHNR